MANIILQPQTISRCESCSMNIFNESEHTCHAVYPKVSWLRTGVYATMPLPLFDIEFIGEMYHHNKNTEKFEMIFDDKLLLSPSTDGLISFRRNSNMSIASYASGCFKRFSVIIATFSENSCRLLFRVETSARHGLQWFKLDLELPATNGCIVLPVQYNLSIVMVLGTDQKLLRVGFRIYANETGAIDYQNFNGSHIFGFIGSQTDLLEFKVN